MNYSQERLAEMAEKIDLVEYARRTVDFVKRSGNTYFAVCPFHKEKTASLAVNQDGQYYHCFGCGASGNVYGWIMATEGLSFHDAVIKVANLTNSDLSDYIESESMSLYKLLNKLSDPKKDDKPVREILDINKDYNDRFSDEIPSEWLEEGILKEELKKYNIRIDNSSNRIVYPVYSDEDELISIKGRTRFKNYKELKIMKYMNYHSLGGRLDYFQGMQQARSHIKKTGEIIIVEGLKSVMKLDGWGYHNVVAAETSVLNEYQIELLIKYQVKSVVIAFDKDVQFKKINDCTKLLKRFTNVFVVYDKFNLLKNKDSPCDKGLDVWKKLYESRIKI